MGKRYHCDYCGKSFPDNPQSKKNHMNGVYHQRNRKAHYDLFRDAATMLAEESLKSPCRKFLQTGDCPFGDGCKFSHLTPARRQELESRAMAEKRNKFPAAEENTFDIEEWLEKRRKMRKSDSDSASTVQEAPVAMATLPPHLQAFPNLPVSLLPAPLFTDNFVVEHWG